MISKYILALEISEVRFDVWQWCILVVCNVMLLRAWNCLYAMGQKILESGVFCLVKTVVCALFMPWFS